MAYDPKTFKYRSGLSSAGAYQVSGVPYLSASVTDLIPKSDGTPYQVSFPYVTQWIIVENTSTGSDLRVGFSSFGVQGVSVVNDVPELNYFILPSSSAGEPDPGTSRSRIKLDVRVKDMFLLCDSADAAGSAQIAAGLTLVETASLAGSSKTVDNHTSNFPNWSGSSGVG